MQLLGAEKYVGPERLPQLEALVEQQAASSELYDLDANLALLRYYQFSPTAAKLPVLAQVLLKALAQLPRPDYRTCILLVPERLLSEEVVGKVTALANALETSRLPEFWTLVSANKDITNLVPGFEAAARTYILHVLGVSFQRVSKAVLGQSLQLQGAALDALVAERVKSAGWQVSGDIVTLPKNEQNTPVVVKRTELVRFEQIAPVLRCVTTSF